MKRLAAVSVSSILIACVLWPFVLVSIAGIAITTIQKNAPLPNNGGLAAIGISLALSSLVLFGPPLALTLAWLIARRLSPPAPLPNEEVVADGATKQSG